MAFDHDAQLDASGLEIVVAEDDRVSRQMLVRVLQKWGYTVHEATDGTQAWETLQRTKAPLLVTDWMMPGMTGVELCRTLREAKLPYYVYAILVTSRGAKEEIVEGFRAGADDYLTKPFEREELKARIRAGERIVKLESDLREARARLEIMASTDELTAVSNRRAVLERLHEALSKAVRTNGDLSVAMIDVDRFKRLNDTFGHAAGDIVLRGAVDRLRSAKREYDVIGRFGGEEFLVVFPETGMNDAATVSERLRSTVGDEPFVLPDGSKVNVTISLGVGCAPGGRVASAEALLAVADAALYQAKDAGRNRVVVGILTTDPNGISALTNSSDEGNERDRSAA